MEHSTGRRRRRYTNTGTEPHGRDVQEQRPAGCSAGRRGDHPPTPRPRCPQARLGDTNRPPPPYWFLLCPRRILREPRGNGKKGSPGQHVGEIPRALSPTLWPRIPRPEQSHRHVPDPGRVFLYHPNLQCRAGATRPLAPPPNQITGTMYLPGEGISYHRDDPLLGDQVSIFGSQLDTTMFFKNPFNGDSFRIRLFARSLLVLTGAARHECHHGTPRRREDEVFGLTVPRTIPRLALILRHIPQAS